MQLSDLQAFVGELCNDPSHTRYTIPDINTELDNTQGQWNQEIKVITATATVTVLDGVQTYSLVSMFGGTPLSFPRTTHKGIDLKKRSKSYFDLYIASDWSQQIGTPTDFYIEATNPFLLNLVLFPIPQAGDAGANLVVEAVLAHTPMLADTDTPFMFGSVSNYLLSPYDFYVAYSAAARLLARDPNPENQARAGQYLKIAGEGKELLITVFKELEAEEPRRMRGGRQW